MQARTGQTEVSADDPRSWTAFISRTMDASHVEVADGHDFHAHARRFQFGSLAACRINASAHRLYCEIDRPQRGQPAGPPKIHVHFQLRGHTHIEQGAGYLDLGPGDWSINALPESYQMRNLDAVEHLTVLVPVEDRPVQLQTLQALSRTAFRSERGIGRIFQNFVVTSFDQLQELNTGTDVHLSSLMISLFHSAMEEQLGAGAIPSSRKVVAARIRALVAARLADPELSIDSIATILRCTKRYMHLVFREQNPGETLGAYILRERLFRSRQALASAGNARKGIARIAYECGFADPAYFSRVFRQTFGITPRDYRNAMACGSA